MFKRRPPQTEEGIPLVPLTEIDTYQRSNDPKSEAPEFIAQLRRDLLLKDIHPWHAPNAIQLRLTMAHIAMFNDRTAEILVDEAQIDTKDGVRVPADVAAFALDLSQHAIRQFDEGRQIAPPYGIEDVEFSDEWRQKLNPETQLPFWPIYWEEESDPPEWQEIIDDYGMRHHLEWQEAEVSGLSTDFLRGIIRAAREMHMYTDENLRGVAASSTVPPEYSEAGIPEYLTERLNAADIDLITAERLTMSALALPRDVKLDNYRRAHDAFIEIMQIGLVAVTPQLLGPDFAPMR